MQNGLNYALLPMNTESKRSQQDTVNPESKILLLDSGRYPLWIRLPTLVIGTFLWWLGATAAAQYYFGFRTSLVTQDKGSPLLGLMIIFGIGLGFLFVWFAQKRISFDPMNRGLFVETRGFVRWHGTLKPLTDGCELHMHYTSVFANGNWELSMLQYDGEFKFLTSFVYFKRDKNWLQSFRDALEEKTGLPVIVHEIGSSWRH